MTRRNESFMQVVINLVGACFNTVSIRSRNSCFTNAISGQKTHLKRTDRLFAGIICLLLSGMTMVAILWSNWVIFPSVKYTWASLGCRWHEFLAYSDGDWAFYQAFRAMKDQLIASSDMAAFLNDCANTGIGKVVQITCLLVATLIFLDLIYWIGMSILRIAQVAQESYLLKVQKRDRQPRNNKMYEETLKGFYYSCKSNTVSSLQLQEHRLYEIYRRERPVVRLLEEKKAREAYEQFRHSA